MKKHFCSCPVTQCARHPMNHDKGCDLCIKDHIEKMKMPACMFKVVNDDVSCVKDYSIEGFSKFYHENRKMYLEKLKESGKSR